MDAPQPQGSWWVWFGKLSAVTLVLLTIVQLRQAIFTDGPQIEAVGTISELRIPPSEIFQPDTGSASPGWMWAKNARLQPDSNEVEVYDEAWHSGVSGLLMRISRAKYVVRIEVSNTGNRLAHEVTLETDSKGVYEISTRDVSIGSGEFNKTITIGDLRPGRSVSVLMWLPYFSSFDQKPLSLVHAEGVEGIEWAEVSTGWKATLLRALDWFVPAVLILGFSAALSLGAAYVDQVRKRARSAEGALGEQDLPAGSEPD